MTTTEYLLNIALVALVLLQIRGIRLTAAALLLPVVMSFWAASQILRAVPTAGNDLVLEIGFGAAGVALGLAAGFATTIRRDGAAAVARAGALAASLWVLGIGARVGLSLWVGHGGAATVHAFSVANSITSSAAWGCGFIFMTLAEVSSRTGVLFVRTLRSGATIERGGMLRRALAAQSR